ncbi:hypothetical protein 031MP002_6 [Bacillus phage 031MP002]|nr:hypothetical protein 031MP002_6 [Bacillus phage 031MP002]
MLIRRLAVVGMSLLVVGGLAACGDTQPADEKKVSEQKQVDKQEKPKKEDSGITVNAPAVSTDNIDAKVISVERKEDVVFGDTYSVKVQVKNKRSDTIAVSANSVSFDGKMVSAEMITMYQEIQAGKAADVELTIASYEEGEHIPTLKKELVLDMLTVDTESYTYNESSQIKVDIK